jgi:hypothetical protein
MISSLKSANHPENLLPESVIIANILVTPTVLENLDAVLTPDTMELCISGTGLVGANNINFYFNPPVYRGVNYDIISSFPLATDQVLLRFRQGFSWQFSGPLFVIGVDTGGGPVRCNGDIGIRVAEVPINSGTPTIIPSIDFRSSQFPSHLPLPSSSIIPSMVTVAPSSSVSGRDNNYSPSYSTRSPSLRPSTLQMLDDRTNNNNNNAANKNRLTLGVVLTVLLSAFILILYAMYASRYTVLYNNISFVLIKYSHLFVLINFRFYLRSCLRRILIENESSQDRATSSSEADSSHQMVIQIVDRPSMGSHNHNSNHVIPNSPVIQSGNKFIVPETSSVYNPVQPTLDSAKRKLVGNTIDVNNSGNIEANFESIRVERKQIAAVLKSLKNQITDAEKELRKLDSDLEDCSFRLAYAISEETSLVTTSKEIIQLQGAVNDIEHQRDNMQTHIAELREAIAASMPRFHELNRQYAKLSNDFEQQVLT